MFDLEKLLKESLEASEGGTGNYQELINQVESQAKGEAQDLESMLTAQVMQNPESIFGTDMMQGAMSQFSDLMGLLDEDEMSEDQLREFLQANIVTGKHAKYLAMGAIMIKMQGEFAETLRLMMEPEEITEILESGWGIEDKQDGAAMLESLLNGRHTIAYQNEFALLKAGQFDEVDEEDAEDWQLSVQMIEQGLNLPLTLVEQCKSILAWDLERVGYLARLFANIDYLTEEETWQWLEKAATKTKQNFKTWEEYMVSLLLGRSIAMGSHPSYFEEALDLLTEERAFLDEHPISAF